MHFRMNNTFLCMLTILTSLYSFSFHYLIDITTTAIMMMIIIKYILHTEYDVICDVIFFFF